MSAAGRKQLPPPAGGDDLTAILRRRHEPAPAPAAAPERPAEQEARPARRTAAPASPVMDRRSWYMPKDVADQLAAAVDDLHFATRQPKHVVLAAIVAAAVDHLDDARARLGGTSHT